VIKYCTLLLYESIVTLYYMFLIDIGVKTYFLYTYFFTRQDNSRNMEQETSSIGGGDVDP
jgi:hypothetical protein